MTIIDRNKKFIYLKSHKTAGTSTEVYLITQTALGSDIYRTSKDIEKYGFAKKRRDREFASFKRALPDPRHSVSDWILATKLKFGSKMRVREHMTGDDVLDLVGQDFFDQCSVVTNVRNPWDALVSSYKWQRGGRGGASRPVEYSFPEFLSWSLGVGDNGISIAEEYLFHPYISGRGWVIDRVIFFEDLARSINDTLSVFGWTVLASKMLQFMKSGLGKRRIIVSGIRISRLTLLKSVSLASFPCSDMISIARVRRP